MSRFNRDAMDETEMNNYSITFKSLRAGTTYIVNIGGGTGAAVPLKGGAQPFVTQEDDSDDMFTPVRTQTGYLRIVDDGFAADGVTAFDWKDLIPATDTSRPVTLTAGGTVVWQGFMQAQNFGGVPYGNPQEREFPVQCPLTALSASDVDATNRELKNFAYIIKQAFDNLTGITINSYIFQGGAKAQEMLLKLVDWQNMIVEDDGNVSGRWDNLQVLTDVCAFWGWTCRMCGSDVYFTCVDDNTLMTNALVLTPANLNQLASGITAGTTSGTFLSSASLPSDVFASTDNSEMVVRGYDKATVTADGNGAADEIMQFAPESVENQMTESTPYYPEIYGVHASYYTANILTFETPFMKGVALDGYGSFNICRINDASKSTKDVIRILRAYTGADRVKLETTFEHSYPGDGRTRFGQVPKGLQLRGVIWQAGQVYTNYDSTGRGNKKMGVRLGIGPSHDDSSTKWWNGASWQTGITKVDFWIGNEDDIFRSVYGPSTSQLTGNTTVVPLPANETLHGKVFIDFLGSDDMPAVESYIKFDIAGFSLDYVYGDADENMLGVPDLPSTSIYKATNNGNVKNEFAADLIWASNNAMKRCYGVIMNSDYSPVETITYGSTQQHPEQHLANRVAVYYATSKRKIDVELRSNLTGTITPRTTEVFDGTTGHASAIGHNWRDDITRLTLLQI